MITETMITKTEQNLIDKISSLRMQLIAKLSEVETEKETILYFSENRKRISDHIFRLHQQRITNIQKKIDFNERKLNQYRRDLYLNQSKTQVV